MKISTKIINSDSQKNILIILVCTTIVYLNTLTNGFVWDDTILLVPNEAYQKFDLIRIFSARANSLEYLPIRDLSYALDFMFWGMNPSGFHLTNLILYLIGLIALYKTVWNIAEIAGEEKKETIAFWTTLIFALHPLHAEVVNFIHGRNTLLAGLFLFVSFNLLAEGIRNRKNFLLFLSIIAFVAAVLSKAAVIFYPLFIAAIFFLLPDTKITVRKKILIVAGFLVIDVFAVWIHLINAGESSVMDINFIMYGNDNWGLIFAKSLQIPFFYIKMLIVPYPLNVLYPVSFVTGAFVLRSIAAGAVLLALLTTAWALRKKYPLPVLATAWYFLALIPALNIFPTFPTVANRYAYLSVLGFALLLSYFLEKAASKNRLFFYLAVVIIIVMGYMDINRNLDWKSDISLWRSEILTNPDVNKIYMAEALWEEGQQSEALKLLKEESEKKGGFYYSQFMGRFLSGTGQNTEAIKYYREAIDRGGDAQKNVHVELAVIYEKVGLNKEALDEYLKTIDAGGIDPLGKHEKTAREGINRIRAGIIPGHESERMLAEQEPDNFRAQAGYALSLHRLGFYEEAGNFYKKALAINPASWEAWYNLAITLMKRHKYKEAVMSFDRSLSLNKTNKDALNNIGICYMSMRNYPRAIKYYEKALSADPDFFYPAFNLGRIYFIKGERDLSVKYFSLAKKMAGGDPGIDARTETYLSQLKKK